MPSIDSRRLALGSFFATALAVGCAAKGVEEELLMATDAGIPVVTEVQPPVDDAGTGGGPGFGDTSAPVPVVPEAVFYAHTGQTLYRVDANDPNLGITKVGAFDCIDKGPPAGKDTSMTDIAVDRAGKIYGIGPSMVFADITISGTTARCFGKGKSLPVGPKVKFFGASFAPVGTVDATSEALVAGNTDGELYKVDPATGDVVLLGNFGNVPNSSSKHWELSGDIVFLENSGNPVGFATVRDCTKPGTCSDTDTLIEIDLKKLTPGNTASVTKAVRGQIGKDPNCQDAFAATYGHMYGIAAYKGDIIGFSDKSFVVKIDNNLGTACRIADHSGIVPTGFAGAGVTTLAPVTAPPPR